MAVLKIFIEEAAAALQESVGPPKGRKSVCYGITDSVQLSPSPEANADIVASICPEEPSMVVNASQMVMPRSVNASFSNLNFDSVSQLKQSYTRLTTCKTAF